MTRALGVDVSACQGVVDWAKLAAGGYSFAYQKATFSTRLIDPTFARNADGARNAGLAFGAYHFLSATTSVEDQATLFTKVIGPLGLDLPPSIDFEFPVPTMWGPTPAAAAAFGALLTTRALAACRLVEDALGAANSARLVALGLPPVMVYTYPDFAHHLPATDDLTTLAATYGLWIARYHDEKHTPTASDAPELPKPWTQWTCWQYSGDHGLPAPGIPVVVDHDVWNGPLPRPTAAVESLSGGADPSGPVA